jgi:tRNA(Ile)-lysidine synthase
MLSESFLDFINKERLFEKQERLLLAISGGLDSVVLAHLLKYNGFQFSLAHMNFQLRGEDSLEDENFVRVLAEKLGVELYVEKVEINKELGSTQLQARELRYDWFQEIMEQYHFSKLLTAHHANDLLETTLMNLVRGTGIKGLRGILPSQNNIVRPLLFADKNEIEEYAKKAGIGWREDISNASDLYKRNKIRHHVIPLLLKENPRLLSGIQQTALRLRAVEAVWGDKLGEIREMYFEDKGKIKKIQKSILDLPNASVFLAELLSEYGFMLSQLQSFDFERIGAQLWTRSHVLSIDRDCIFVSLLNEYGYKENFPKEFRFEENEMETPFGILKWDEIEKSEVNFSQGNNVAYIDKNKLADPMHLDIWNVGDKIQPLGMKGMKKISDILIDQKVPLYKKEMILVIKSAGKIVWLPGYKFSEAFKITDSTSEILRIEYYENSESF